MNCFPWYATELFLQVCEAGGLSAASRFGKTGISQPALSAQMMSLEQHLGTKLFLRKPFDLTAEGRVFLEEALRIRNRMTSLRDTLGGDSERPLRIATSDLVIRDHLPALLRQMDVATRKRLILREAQSQDLAGLIRTGDADLAIGLLANPISSGANPLVEKIGQLPLIVLVPPSYADTVTTWQDLIRLLRKGNRPGLIGLSPANLFMRHVCAALRRAGVEWLTTLEVSSIGHAATYVDLDFGFAFGLAIPVEATSRNSRAIIQPPPNSQPHLNLVVWHGESLDPFASRLLNLIRRYAGQLLKPASAAKR